MNSREATSVGCANRAVRRSRTTYGDAVRMVRGWNAWHLSSADRADCGSPDSLTSPGAEFLTSVRDTVLYAFDEGRILGTSVDEDLCDVISEIADGAPDVYTYTRWLEFVDLAAYNEDAGDSPAGEWPDDLTDAAGAALYIIAERLAASLIEYIADNANDDDETGGDDE